ELKEDSLRTIMWLRQRGFTKGPLFRAAFTQNKAPEYEAVKNMFLALPQSSSVTSEIQAFPFTDPYMVRRYAIHAYNDDPNALPAIFDQLKQCNGLFVPYTHLVTETGSTFDISRERWNQFLTLVDNAVSEGWL